MKERYEFKIWNNDHTVNEKVEVEAESIEEAEEKLKEIPVESNAQVIYQSKLEFDKLEIKNEKYI